MDCKGMLAGLAFASLGWITATPVVAGVTTEVVPNRESGYSWHLDYEPSASLSGNGRYVAYTDYYSGPFGVDIEHSEVYVLDRQTGVSSIVSIGNDGDMSQRYSGQQAISDDGRFVAFTRYAAYDVDSECNGLAGGENVFVRDRTAGTQTCVSMTDRGAVIGGNNPALSGDGRFVAYLSATTNVASQCADGTAHLYVHDRANHTTRCIAPATTVLHVWATQVAVNRDGRYVAFLSNQPLTPNCSGGQTHVFVRDRQAGKTICASVDSLGIAGNGPSRNPVLSGDGHIVVFTSSASNLVAGDTNANVDVFAHDLVANVTTRVSVNSAGAQVPWAVSGGVSADGRYVTVIGDAALATEPLNYVSQQIFVHDRLTKKTFLVGKNNEGIEANSGSGGPIRSISNDGRIVLFGSTASNMRRDFAHGAYSWFVRDRVANLLEGPPGAASCSDGIDNDGDGTIDQADGDCVTATPERYCAGERATLVVTGNPWRPKVRGTSGRDVIFVEGSDIWIDGLDGDDLICSDGWGSVYGGTGNDTITVHGSHRLYGGAGNDMMTSIGSTKSFLVGGGGNDVLYGLGDFDVLNGGAGNDKLFGGDGNNKLSGGTGIDYCDGGPGVDSHTGGCETLLNVP